MSNTVKIKNKKKKNEVKVNYKLWAIIFGVFVAAIVGLSVWASFHWGVGMGTIGVRPVDPEEAGAAATDSAAEFATDAMVLTPEQLEEMGISLDDVQSAEGAEDAGETGEGEETEEAGEAGKAAETEAEKTEAPAADEKPAGETDSAE